jgi:preprotein translocase subunit YajC
VRRADRDWRPPYPIVEDVVKLESLLPLLLLAVLFYLLVMRPAQRRQREASAVVSALQPGVQVMTTAGLYGTVRSVADDTVELEIAPDVVVRMVKQAIGKVVTPVPDEGDDQRPDDELPEAPTGT